MYVPKLPGTVGGQFHQVDLAHVLSQHAVRLDERFVLHRVWH